MSFETPTLGISARPPVCRRTRKQRRRWGLFYKTAPGLHVYCQGVVTRYSKTVIRHLVMVQVIAIQVLAITALPL